MTQHAIETTPRLLNLIISFAILRPAQGDGVACMSILKTGRDNTF